MSKQVCYIDKQNPGIIRFADGDGFDGLLAGRRAPMIAQAINCHADLLAALKSAQAHVCSALCPSVKRTGKEWAHSEICKAAMDAIAKAENPGDKADT